jgi:hypothetical protein
MARPVKWPRYLFIMSVDGRREPLSQREALSKLPYDNRDPDYSESYKKLSADNAMRARAAKKQKNLIRGEEIKQHRLLMAKIKKTRWKSRSY